MGFFSRFKGRQREDQDDTDGDTEGDLPDSAGSVSPPHGEAPGTLKGDGGSDGSDDDDADGTADTDAASSAEENGGDGKRQLDELSQAGGADKTDTSGPVGRVDNDSDSGDDGGGGGSGNGSSGGDNNDHDDNDDDNDNDGGKGKPDPAAESARDDGPDAGANSVHPGAPDAHPAEKRGLEDDDAAAQGTKMLREHESELQQQISNEEDIAQRIKKVKEEYGVSVKSLMETRRELNQKRDEMSATKASLERLRAEIDEKRKLRAKTEAETAEKKKELARVQTQVEEALLSHGELEKKISAGQHTLSAIKTQQAETERELEEINARLYNAREEFGRQEQFPEPGALSSAERAFIQGGTESAAGQEASGAAPGQDALQSQQGEESRRYAGVVEAASVVVASLKSKLGMMQKELEAAQLMLEQERAQHEATKRKLESLTDQDSPGK